MADVVTDWNSLLLDSIRVEDTAPPLAARNLAILHTAIYDAVNAVEQTHSPYFVKASAPAGTLEDVAALAAAYTVSLSLYPSESSRFNQAYANYLSSVSPGPGRDNGLALGRSVADQILAWRSADGASTSVPYIPRSEPGQWRRTPPFYRPPDLPQWPYVAPFAMTRGDQFRPPGPPPLNSARWASDYNQVKDLGAANSATRTAEQTQTARFWSDFSYTVTPPGHWNEIAATVGLSQGNTLAENARLFALLNLAEADAAIVAWDAKYLYNSWRPVTAIHAGDTDANPDTVADPDWAPLLNTPSHPDYISGHSTFSAAAATVLADFFGTDEITFSVGSDGLPGVTRTYHSFAQTAEEIGMSRIYAGIHTLSADQDGLVAGRELGGYVSRNYLQAIPEPQVWLLAAWGGLLGFLRWRWRPGVKRRGPAGSADQGSLSHRREAQMAFDPREPAD